MKQPRPDFVDELEESARDVVKIAKKQIAAKTPPPTQQDDSTRSFDSAQDKKDPVTGKPMPSKKMLTQLSQQTAQLAQVRLKKVREELEKQRLKVKQAEQVKQVDPVEKPQQPKDDAVQKTLKASKSTGEFKGLIGG